MQSFHLIRLPPILTTLLLAAACTGTDPTGDEAEETGDTDETGTEPTWDEVRSEEPHDVDPQTDDAERSALASDNHALSLDLYHALREDKAADEGFSISAYSIQSAFGMLYGGTVEPSRGEMQSTLHFSLADERQHEGLNWIDAQLSARNLPAFEDEFSMAGPVELHTANGVWIDQGLRDGVHPAYLDLLAIHYDAGVYLADFFGQPDVERMSINSWVAARTRDLIPELFSPGDITGETTMVLVNSLYLEAPWNEPFDESSTSKEPFTRLDGSTVDVDMMSAYEMWAGYAEGEGWKAVALPLRGGSLELVAIVPDDFASFEAGLDVATLDSVLGALEQNSVSVDFPRFTVRSNYSLVDELKALGMPTPFEDLGAFADVSTPPPGRITQVVHQTVIEVDEKGTTAAAATGIVVGEGGGNEPMYNVRVDRPFLLAIRDEPTDTLLFFGRVLDPSI